MQSTFDWLLKGGDLHILAALQSAGIAQLVEHLIRNEGVAGSIPVFGTKLTAARRFFFGNNPLFISLSGQFN